MVEYKDSGVSVKLLELQNLFIYVAYLKSIVHTNRWKCQMFKANM